MTRARSIAVAQTVPVRGDVTANVEQHLALVRLAAMEHAGVLVFPELSLTGYELELAEELAFSEEDPRVAPLLDAARSHSMILVVGAPIRLGRDLHIGVFLLDPDRTVAIYTKHHLGAFPASASCDGVVPPAEATVFEPGERDPLVRLDGGPAAVAVCADVGRPSHALAAAERGARSYLASMFVIPSGYAGEVANLRDRAVRHGMLVAFANYGAPTGGLASAGRSAIWSEQGELLVQLEEHGCGVAVASEGPEGWRVRAATL